MFGKKYPNCVKKITEAPSFEVGGKKTTGMGGMTPGDVERLKLGNPGAAEKIDGKYKEIRRGINLPLAKKENKGTQLAHYEPEGTQIDEAPKTIYSVGQTYSVVLNWRTKVINIKFFFPTQQRPTKEEVQAAIDKIYPGAVLYMYTPAINDPTKPFIFANEDSMSDESVIETYINKRKKMNIDETAAWQRKEGKNPEGGLNKAGIASYRRENPGSKLSMAVTTPPSKLKPGSKSANRRKSFCARMGGVDGPMKDDKGRPTRKALALRKWNC